MHILKPTYDILEDALKARLAPLLQQGFEVEVLQGKPGDYVKAFAKSRFTVMARGGTFEQPFNGSPRPDIRSISGTVTQVETVKVDVMLESRNMRGFDGIYSMRALCQGLLLGYAPKPWTPFFLQSFQFDANTDGVWSWIVTFSSTCTHVAAVDQVTEVLITQLNTIENITS